MQKQLNAVKEFHKTFKIDFSETITADLGTNKHKLRYDLMKEENEEYLDAVEKKDIVEIADALGDMLYILCGTIIEHGLQYKIEAIFNEIQRSNMSKLDHEGNPIYREDGKVMKGSSYSNTDFSKIL